MITANELRGKYLEFFKSKEHVVIAPASLIPENDPTSLFTMAGMHPLVPYLMGERHPEGKRLTDYQKCIRTIDIDEVGDNSHVTFMEMLGNWSLGDYFKKEIIPWSWEFLTSPAWLGLDKEKLAVTVFGGDERFPDLTADEESITVWKEVGVSDDRIAKMPGGVLEHEDNWWGPAGTTGPCGPSTEIFYWIGEDLPPPGSNPATDEENWLEIWNNVLMQFNKTINNTFEPLKENNIDTGVGLERTLKVINGFQDVYQIDTLWPLIQKMEEISGREYVESREVSLAMRIAVDHIRAAVMIIGDQRGVAPSNVDQGYVVRRIIRRAIRKAHCIGVSENFCSILAKVTLEIFKEAYPEVIKNKDYIITEISKEESKFRNTLEKGLKIFNKNIESKKWETKIPASDAFDLYQSYGFPIEMTIELAQENGLAVDEKGFDELMKKHQDLSRAGAENKFKGGLADDGEMSKKYHTATHLLHAALRKVLGEHVEQRGSNITSERLRFDFSHGEKLTDEQKQEVEELVNKAIEKDYPVSFVEMTVEEAKKCGAIGLFEDKYGNKVRVYTVGDPKGMPNSDISSPTFSMEICGGPHVENTGVLGKFRIKKEKASSAGIRRIKGVLD